MRDPHDAKTAEIPGVRALPPKLTAKERRAAAHYLAPKQGPSCRHCTHRGTWENTTLPHCTKHDFGVYLSAICADYTGPAVVELPAGKPS